MKKYFFFAAAALLALAACSKVNYVEQPDQEISFQVVNHVSRTKAESLLDEKITSFTTNAWFTPEEGSVQRYIKDTEIKADNTTVTTVTKWAPDAPIYWPKTGTLNFYSYASYPALANTEKPSYTDEPSSFILNNYTVTDHVDGNLVVANPAMKYSSQSTMVRQIPNIETKVGAGVPILFNHMLAKVTVKVVVATDEEASNTNQTWKVFIKNGNVLLTVPNKGNLNVRFASYTSDDAGLRDFVDETEPNPETETSAYYWWSIVEGTSDTMIPDSGNKTYTYPDETTPTGGYLFEVTQGETSEAQTLVDEYVVIPQLLSGLEMNFVYTLENKNGDVTVVDKDIEVPITLTSFSNAFTRWAPNTKYEYTITIRPDAAVIQFNAAVNSWIPGGTATYTIQ